MEMSLHTTVSFLLLQSAHHPRPLLEHVPFLFRGQKKKREGVKTKRWLCVPGTVDRAGVRPVICEQKDCVRRLGETGISDGGGRRGGGIPGLWFLACLIIRHMYAPFSPPVLPPGNNMLFVHPGAFASEIRTTARN